MEAMNTHVESDEVLEGAFGAAAPIAHGEQSHPSEVETVAVAPSFFWKA